MRKLLVILLLGFCQQLLAQTYITNVSVADVVNKKWLPGQTVVIRDGKIEAVQSAKKLNIPAGANTVDGTGKFLVPGLVDAHIHFFQNGGLYTRPDAIDLRKFFPYEKEMELAHGDMEDKLRSYLRAGITTVMDVGSSYYFLRAREAFRQRDSLPELFITGPLATTYEPPVYKGLKEDEPFNLVKSEEEGIKMVQQQLPLRPDFIKIWYIAGADGLSVEASARKNLPIVKAVIEEAHRHGLKVGVHATEQITAQLAVENGADFLVHGVEDQIVSTEFVQLLKKNKTIVCPTLVVAGNYNKVFAQEIQFTPYELLMGDARQIGTLMDLRHLSDSLLTGRYKRAVSTARARESLRKDDSIRMANLKILADAGVLIATGTDAGNIGTIHAASYLSELQTMRQSGMSNWQILQASTLNGAKVLGREKEFGTISPGSRANLLLLDANPIDSLENITRLNRIIINGHWIDPDSLANNSPENLAQRQLNAYNQRDIDAFVEPYAEDVEVYDFPNKLLFRGRETMRREYAGMFKNTPDLHCELKNRIVQGNMVIDHERVRFGKNIVEAVAIYLIENGRISKVYFMQ